MANQQLRIREIQSVDIDSIIHYWLDSDKAYLKGMGVDLSLLPKADEIRNFLENQIKTPIEEKTSYALIWELNNHAIGHCNVNEIDFGNSAKMHLHLWDVSNRKKGIGTELVQKSTDIFFKNLKLKTIICEPYANNEAPNKTLAKCGFEFQKKYITTPGTWNFEQEVCRWELTKAL